MSDQGNWVNKQPELVKQTEKTSKKYEADENIPNDPNKGLATLPTRTSFQLILRSSGFSQEVFQQSGGIY